MSFGLLNLGIWGTLLTILVLTHVSIASVTIFLHRYQAHHSIDLHPFVSHFFRFWLWLTTGMVTKEWVAIHRKHHSWCETADDPHSPQVHGIWKVLFEGTELYRQEARNVETLKTFGHGTPDDWLERHLYGRHSAVGVGIMLVADVVVLGPIGLSVWAAQMMWIPVFAAGVINGAGHYWGYRFFSTGDASRNILPWGVLICGEELHNNHHAYAASAKLSRRWWEFDLGWLYIRSMEFLHLATVRRIAPKLQITPDKTVCDVETLRAVRTHRYLVLGQFADVLKPTALREIRKAGITHAISGSLETLARRALKRWLQGGTTLNDVENEALHQVFCSSKVLQMIASMRKDLTALWSNSAMSPEQHVKQLEDWCHRAETSGIKSLREWSLRLRQYTCPRIAHKSH